MNKLTGEEIIKILSDNLDSVKDFAYQGISITASLGVGIIEEVAKYGGQGKGEIWYKVYYFKDHDVYLKVDGFYASYDGTTFGDWNEAVKVVVPREKTITVYE